MSRGSIIKADLIAPCGMNCALCMAYQRDKNTCPGCRAGDESKPASCVACIIVNCPERESAGLKYCSDRCGKYPCKRLKNLDKRYRTKYGMSMIENLEYIRESGIRAFVRNEKERWTCPECGSVFCVHRSICFNCGTKLPQ